MSTTENCRWCGHPLNVGYNHCTNCHKNQSRLSGFIGNGTNVIGLIAALVTLGQLLLAIEQNNSAVNAADIAEKAKVSTEEALLNYEKLEIRLKQIEIDTRQALSEIKQIELDSKVAENKNDIKIFEPAQFELKGAQDRYFDLKGSLAGVAPTLSVEKEIKTTITKCTTCLLYTSPSPRD